MIPQPFALAVALASAVCFASELSAQATKTERRVYSRVLDLQSQLLDACTAGERGDVRAAGEVYGAASRTDPLVRAARAVVTARGGSFDSKAHLRGAVFAVVMPEVAELSRFEDAYITLRSARKQESDHELSFECRLLDAAGEEVRKAVYDGPATAADLMGVDVTTRLNLRGLAEGRYQVVIDILVDGERAGPAEPSLTAPLWVRKDYGARIERQPLYLDPFHPDSAARGEQNEKVMASLTAKMRDAADRAAYACFYQAVDRAFRGEPQVPGVDPNADLDRLERVLDNIENDRPVFDGIHGTVTLGLPEEGAADHLLRTPYVRVSVDLPEPGSEAAETPKPLVLVLPGTATWDGEVDRPLAVRGVAPEWMRDQLRRVGFGADGAFHLAVMESPGRVASPTKALGIVTRALSQLLPVTEGQVFWVGDREGAYCVSRAVVLEPGLARGAVLVNGGGLSVPELDALSERSQEILVVTSAEHPSAARVDGLVERGGRQVRLSAGSAELRPWPIAVPLAADEIERFVQRLQ